MNNKQKTTGRRPLSGEDSVRATVADELLGEPKPLTKGKPGGSIGGRTIAASVQRPPKPLVPDRHPYRVNGRKLTKRRGHTDDLDSPGAVRHAYTDNQHGDPKKAWDKAEHKAAEQDSPVVPRDVHQAILSGGQGFTVTAVATAVREDCRYCGDNMVPDRPDAECELGGGYERCRCSGCDARRYGRKAGRPRIVCESPECQAKYADYCKEQDRLRARARREHDRFADVEYAAHNLPLLPADWTDKQVGAHLDVRPIRVKEARAFTDT